MLLRCGVQPVTARRQRSACLQHELGAAVGASPRLIDAVLHVGLEGPGPAGGRVEHTVHEP